MRGPKGRQGKGMESKWRTEEVPEVPREGKRSYEKKV
jgi:hypothetical protein